MDMYFAMHLIFNVYSLVMSYSRSYFRNLLLSYKWSRWGYLNALIPILLWSSNASWGNNYMYAVPIVLFCNLKLKCPSPWGDFWSSFKEGVYRFKPPTLPLHNIWHENNTFFLRIFLYKNSLWWKAQKDWASDLCVSVTEHSIC